jgi:hypothetical protein
MSYLRFNLDLAIKEPVPETLAAELPAIKQAIRRLKTYASKINQGTANEEITVKANHHICRHDEGLPCDQETEI